MEWIPHEPDDLNEYDIPIDEPLEEWSSETTQFIIYRIWSNSNGGKRPGLE